MEMGTGGAGTGATATWGVLGSADVALPVLTAADAACAGAIMLLGTVTCHAMPQHTLSKLPEDAGRSGRSESAPLRPPQPR